MVEIWEQLYNVVIGTTKFAVRFLTALILLAYLAPHALMSDVYEVSSLEQVEWFAYGAAFGMLITILNNLLWNGAIKIYERLKR